MYRNHYVGVVVPVYNEAEKVGAVLDELPQFVDVAYPVDDCSTDGSWLRIRARESGSLYTDDQSTRQRSTPDGGETNRPATERDRTAAAMVSDGPPADPPADGTGPPRPADSTPATPTARSKAERRMPRDEAGEGPAIVGIRHETNRGRGAAVKTGYRAALNDGIDIVAVLDGDGQMDPEMLDSFVDPIVEAEADYAKGNRLETPETRAEMSNWRLFGNTVLTGLTRVASGYWGMTDPQNGYTAISRDALKRLEFDSLYDGYGFLNDVLVRLNAQDVKIVDIPMRALYGDEESGIQYSSFVPVLSLLLLRRFVWRIGTKYDLSAFHPVAVLYGLAAAVGLGGIAYGVHAVAVADGPLRIPIAAVSVLACLFFVGVAFVTERHYNRDLELDVGADRPLGNR